MDCLTPAVAYVPIDEWYCPACASRIQPHVDPEELLHEGHAEEGLGGIPRVRATRGRPRGSTARRVSALGRTGLYMRMMFLHVYDNVYQQILEFRIMTVFLSFSVVLTDIRIS